MEKPKRYDYRILYLMPEVPQGHVFSSEIPDIEDRPELWQEKCPYHIDDDQMSYVVVEKDQ